MKDVHAMFVSALMQLTFHRYNSYWIKQRCETNDFIQCGIIWPPSIEVELTMSNDRLIKKSYCNVIQLQAIGFPGQHLY